MKGVVAGPLLIAFAVSISELQSAMWRKVDVCTLNERQWSVSFFYSESIWNSQPLFFFYFSAIFRTLNYYKRIKKNQINPKNKTRLMFSTFLSKAQAAAAVMNLQCLLLSSLFHSILRHPHMFLHQLAVQFGFCSPRDLHTVLMAYWRLPCLPKPSYAEQQHRLLISVHAGVLWYVQTAGRHQAQPLQMLYLPSFTSRVCVALLFERFLV